MSMIELPRSARDVARILRQRTGSAAAEFQRHVVDGVRPRVSQQCRSRPLLNRLSTVTCERVVVAQPVGSEVTDVGDGRSDADTAAAGCSSAAAPGIG